MACSSSSPRYNTDAMIPIYAVCGIVYGMVELIRRVMPRDIVGGNIQKLRKMDSLVGRDGGAMTRGILPR